MKVGFIGLGRMGRGMALNLQKAGHDMVVNDLSVDSAQEFLDAGASWAGTPRELAQQCGIVFTSLPTPADVKRVGLGPDGLVEGLAPDSVWVDLSTNSVDVVRELSGFLAEKGAYFIDAPVSGGPAGAASRKLAIWCGGDEAVYHRCKPFLDAMADQPRYIGAIGGGTIAKLVNNMASTAIISVLAEVLTMGVKAGLEPGPLWEAIRTGAAGRMRMYDNIGRRFMQAKYDPASFALRLVHKDASLALQVGRDFGVPMRLCGLVESDIREALNRGWGERDSQSYLALQQERAGVEPFRLSPEEVDRILADL
ncbi:MULTISPECIES: NAD(P)-dependent oxidoreductase [Paracoccus]|jgi:3-hydroxyisobutyrate dehydrogenase|uniref:Tartronate semialdehyde reductase n=1 Tax=Paracoccus denitrificans (strain Pd 1222) TaxID=318586 RepID=A1B703_PARDP|nr:MULTISPECIES: NAD(P)-dependent oxidoreductase [Paracoccus]ABL71297.1 tartronate semialdehyde reductase [Paracoccus denitrificans PD1222]MBB4629590.1 3-hydroxyisobutyrate dehydrogenase [Paracoccus denitrificans]MCU7430986.1 NAD(P)-dependent oxidoreductase [Paracoccus denitrificans]QAR27927.1 NAD(P)-dependent oxidoreductase [Paracoccus denitrificans]UPV97641.1 NAD(P)-dependent oxidoreductase [Paracoccus denitrificans]